MVIYTITWAKYGAKHPPCVNSFIQLCEGSADAEIKTQTFSDLLQITQSGSGGTKIPRETF